MPSLLEQIAAAKRRGIRSAPQNAVLSHAAQGFQTQGFQNHIPARGRKLLYGSLWSVVCGARFQNHIPARGRKPINPFCIKHIEENISKPHPRKGTETMTTRKPILRKSTHFKTTSPQGDGNACTATVTALLLIFQNHIPARGRKRFIPFQVPHEGNNFKTTSPQGDGNRSFLSHCAFCGANFKNTSP